MAQIINYPSRNNANMDEWRVMIEGLEHYAKGVFLINVGNIDTSGAPTINAGSIFYVNGSLYKCTSDESIGGSAAGNGQNYVYAVPAADGLTVSFLYSTDKPQWEAAKGGWYNENNRAILKVYRVGDMYNNKVILDSYSAINANNTQQVISGSGSGSGVWDKVYTGPINTVIRLDPGIYEVSVKDGAGGAGGAGGLGGYYTDPATMKPTRGPSGEAGNNGIGGGETSATNNTIVLCGSFVKIMTGFDGGDGGQGGEGGNAASSGNAYVRTGAGRGGRGGNGGNGGASFFGLIDSSDILRKSNASGAGAAGEGGNASTWSYNQTGGMPGDPPSPVINPGSPGSPGNGAKPTSSGWVKYRRVG
jgi:hypothetical protein